MTDEENLFEWARYETMKQVVVPSGDGPDLADDFEGGLDAITATCKSKLLLIPVEQRHEYFVGIAEGAIEWSRENRLEPLLDSSQAWLRRLRGEE